MLTFAVVTSRTGRTLGTPYLERLGSVAERGDLDVHLATPVTERILWTNDAGTTAAVAWWSGHDAFESGVLWHATPHSFTALAGRGWPRGEGWDWSRPWAAQLAALASTDDFAARIPGFSGVFGACHFDERGGTIFSDPFGLGLIHVGTNDEVEVFSSRAAIAAHLITPRGSAPRRDPLAAGWLAFSQVMVEDTTGYEAVDVVPECTRIDIDPSGRTRRVATPHPSTYYADGLDPDEAIAIIHDDLVAELTAISTMRGLPRVCDLTGGKDSRVILALLIEAGIAGRFEYFTSGAETLPDVQIARTLRDRYGLVRHTPDLRRPEDEWNRNDPKELWDIYRQFSFATSGMQTLWSYRTLGAPGRRISINGIGGEPLYTNYPGSARLRTASELHTFLRAGQKFRKSATATADAREHYEGATDRLVDELWHGCTYVQDAVDRYYLKIRMRRWFGTGQEIDRNNRIFPLFGGPSIAAAFGLGHELRQAQYVSFRLMDRVDRTLVTTPFADDTWPERLMNHVDDTGIGGELLGEPMKIRGSVAGGKPGSRPRINRLLERRRIYSGDLLPKLNAQRARREKRLQDQIALFRAVLADDPANPLFTVTDHAATIDLIDNYERLPHQLKQLVMGAFTAAVWLGEHDVSPFAD